jgi:uncharacterized membrane protein YfcA
MLNLIEPHLKTILFISLALVTVWFVAAWVEFTWRKRWTVYHALVAFVMCFFDTLGIGNFATTTPAFKFRGSVPDEKIPGTLNVGYALPTVAQAFIYTRLVEVNAVTLVLMIVAAVLGAWLGAGVVAKWPRRNIQIGMGLALLGAATLLFFTLRGIAPSGGSDLALVGTKMWLGLAGNFALGALMTLGIGLYGPCLILVSLLGMDPRAAFPIMMGSCAFLMPVGGIRFVKEGRCDLSATIIMTLAGLPAVLIAAFIVTSMPLNQVRWLVLFVVIFTAAMMLRSAFTEKNAPPQAAPAD